MYQFHDKIDEITNMYIKDYKATDFKILNTMLDEEALKYKLSYGGDNNYKENKLNKEIYSKLGNVILTQLRDYDKEMINISKTSSNVNKISKLSPSKNQFINYNLYSEYHFKNMLNNLRRSLNNSFEQAQAEFEYEQLQAEIEGNDYSL